MQRGYKGNYVVNCFKCQRPTNIDPKLYELNETNQKKFGNKDDLQYYCLECGYQTSLVLENKNHFCQKCNRYMVTSAEDAVEPNDAFCTVCCGCPLCANELFWKSGRRTQFVCKKPDNAEGGVGSVTRSTAAKAPAEAAKRKIASASGGSKMMRIADGGAGGSFEVAFRMDDAPMGGQGTALHISL